MNERVGQILCPQSLVSGTVGREWCPLMTCLSPHLRSGHNARSICSQLTFTGAGPIKVIKTFKNEKKM